MYKAPTLKQLGIPLFLDRLKNLEEMTYREESFKTWKWTKDLIINSGSLTNEIELWSFGLLQNIKIIPQMTKEDAKGYYYGWRIYTLDTIPPLLEVSSGISCSHSMFRRPYRFEKTRILLVNSVKFKITLNKETIKTFKFNCVVNTFTEHQTA